MNTAPTRPCKEKPRVSITTQRQDNLRTNCPLDGEAYNSIDDRFIGDIPFIRGIIPKYAEPAGQFAQHDINEKLQSWAMRLNHYLTFYHCCPK